MSFESQINQKIKLTLLGDSMVGKSQIIMRFCLDQFNQNTPSTLGVQFFSKQIYINDEFINLQIWDTAGQEKFRSLCKQHLLNSKGVILVYSVDNQQSYDSINYYLQLTKQSLQDIPITLVANKSDLINKEVDKKQAEYYAKENNMQFIEASAKDNKNIDDIFFKLTEGKVFQIHKINQQQDNFSLLTFFID
ncbi:P-loop containing nucleoside triphosphate hydrolase [Pseudocohnilembus persalinus]|uniref:p-loop containing nucleoside triphosphate hydrolase n=1 Tax=Pseudocohnilembus persalinus TaxID=266149 RepID=A0A0V0QBM1_PSEPJ|nr:P-loop containing nucleoside triphosphate hydrolase [Pseudocohnilembus persalinus]|eukprot:KRW99621.1 P-loop containing nucleoside triphosphate hydrolase [Pseudocohnilembus persalinus]